MAARYLADVYTVDEVARAAHVPTHAVEELIRGGAAQPVHGFLTPADALAVGRRLRLAAVTEPVSTAPLFSAAPDRSEFAKREPRLPAILSSSVHAVVLGLILWATAGAGATTGTTQPLEPSRLVFLMTPGPGGGGGGGGNRAPKPAAKLERRGPPKPRIAVPKVTPDPVLTTANPVVEPARPTPAVTPQPAPHAPEPTPTHTLIAPVAENSADTRDQSGVVEKPAPGDSQGQGLGGGAGSGQGTGNGEGLGAGIGEGSGGGTGGGPFRPGSGVEPPRLLREVKAEYTEEARRRNIKGDVVLEIVVRSDGNVGDVRVLQGLGGGLESRAVDAVRQWKFAPATRRGQPVDVLVEVAVEFTLR
jgi:protein TonB